MPRNPWLALDTATPSRSRARELRDAWERFVGEGSATVSGGDAGLRAPIIASWERSREAGVDPLAELAAPSVADAVETSSRWDVHALCAAVPIIRQCVGVVVEEAQGIVVVTDAEGVVLWVDGDPRTRLDSADMINLAEGACWSEAGAGTNAIGTGLAAHHAVQVFAGEHFNQVVHAWTCSAAPVKDPETGEVLGIIDLTGRANTASPYTFASAVATAEAVEAHLRAALNDRDERLRSRFDELIRRGGRRALVSNTGRILSGQPEGWLPAERLSLPPGGGEVILPSGVHVFAEPVGHSDAYVLRELDGNGLAAACGVAKVRLLGRDRAILQMDGRSVRLSRRHTEVLALLASRPTGMTSEELAADLYGDRGTPAAARVEVSRLRKVLRGGIDAESYSLAIDIQSDLARVRGLLDRGEVRAAVQEYPGPLLPHSEAPGVVRDREALESWVHHAVMTADDGEALWAWVQCSSGQDDLPAWKRLLAQLEFRDPRRSLAAARISSLRTAYAVA